jgi:hypothetical protein
VGTAKKLPVRAGSVRELSNIKENVSGFKRCVLEAYFELDESALYGHGPVQLQYY